MRPPTLLLRDISRRTTLLRYQSVLQQGSPLALATRVRCSSSPSLRTSVGHNALHPRPYSSYRPPRIWTKPKAQEEEVKRGSSVFPQRLLIYYAGRRTIYLACTKLCTIFMFAFGVAVIAPSWYRAIMDPDALEKATTAAVAAVAATNSQDITIPETKTDDKSNPTSPSSAAPTIESSDDVPGTITFHLPAWLPFEDTPITLPRRAAAILTASGVVLMSSIPFLLMQYIAPPYVTHVHITLPFYARQSGDYLAAYIARLPPYTTLDMITMGPLGRPQYHTVPVGELRLVSRRMGCVNLVWRGRVKRPEKKPPVEDKMCFYIDPRGSPAKTLDAETGAARLLLAKIGEWTREGVPVERPPNMKPNVKKSITEIKNLKNVEMELAEELAREAAEDVTEEVGKKGGKKGSGNGGGKGGKKGSKEVSKKGGKEVGKKGGKEVKMVKTPRKGRKDSVKLPSKPKGSIKKWSGR